MPALRGRGRRPQLRRASGLRDADPPRARVEGGERSRSHGPSRSANGRRASGVLCALIGAPAEDASYRHVDGVRPRRRRERDLRRRPRDRHVDPPHEHGLERRWAAAAPTRSALAAPLRRVGGAGGRRRDGATARLAVKHALVAECYKCFVDECSRGRSCGSIEFCVRRRRPRLHVAPTTRGGASDRGVADAGRWTRCCRAVRLLVVVSYLLSIVEALTRLPRVSSLSRQPGLVQLRSWARTACLPRRSSTCARLIDRVSRRRLNDW